MDRTPEVLRHLVCFFIVGVLSCILCRAEELQILGRWPGYRRGVPVSAAIENRIACFAMGKAGIAVFNLDDPEHPRRIGDLILPDGAAPWRIVMDGSRAVTRNRDSGLSAIDLEDPTQPRHVATLVRSVLSDNEIDFLGGATLISVYDSERNQSTLEVWDLFDGKGPRRLSVIDLQASTFHWGFLAPRLVFAGGHGLRVYDVADWSNPVLVSELPNENIGLGHSVALIQDKVLLSSPPRVVDFSNLSAPTVVQLPVTNYLSRLVWSGASAWGVGEGVLWRINPGEAESTVKSFNPGLDPAFGDLLAVSESVLLVGNPSQGVHILDLSEAESPRIAARLTNFGYTTRVKIADDLAYVADGPGISILQVTNPANPQLVGKLPPKSTRSEGVDLDLKGDLLVWADRVSKSVSLHSITNKLDPVLLKDFTLKGSPQWLVARAFASNRVAVAVNGTSTLGAVDWLEWQQDWRYTSGSWPRSSVIEDMSWSWETLFVAGPGGVGAAIRYFPPGSGSWLALPATAHGVSSEGPYAYVACDRAGLIIVECSRYETQRIVGSAETEYPARSVALKLPYVFVATGRGGVEVFDVVDVTQPRRVARVDIDGDAQSIEMLGDALYVSCGEEGVCVLEFQPGRRDQMIQMPRLFTRDPAGPPFRIPVSSSSGLPVQLRIVYGPAELEGDLCRPTGAIDNVLLRAEQGGDNEFQPAVAHARFWFTALTHDLVRTWMFQTYPDITSDQAVGTSDPDQDGFSNRMEHLLGTDPLAADSRGRLPIPRMEETGADRVVTITLPIQADPVFSFHWADVFLTTTDLTVDHWRRVPAEWVEAGWDSVRLRVPLDEDGSENAPVRFFKLYMPP